ncbi:MAG: hypothetical protein RML40_11645 [Bacteroidota bacterium]|nr:hypothetical protein [Candidatus Kapabacteria bacterium]MDW8221170.1 hypothetical protein [Bacteroidota bacterium]
MKSKSRHHKPLFLQSRASQGRQPRNTLGRFSPIISLELARIMYYEYSEHQRSYTALARMYGFSRSSIHEAFRRFGFATSSHYRNTQHRSRWNNEHVQHRILTLYAAGETIPEICRILDIRAHHTTIAALLRRQGIHIRTRAEEEARRWASHRQLIPTIVQEYRQGIGVPTIARKYNVHPSFCYKWLRRSGVTIRHWNDPVYHQRSQV